MIENPKARFQSDVSAAIFSILRSLHLCTGIDHYGPNFVHTPGRVAKAYVEIFDGLFEDKNKLTEILSKTFPSKSREMVTVGPIHTWSMCAHHLLPVEMKIWIGYMPDKKVLGLSKLARLADLLAKKPGLQEDATVEIAETLFKGLKPKGCGCYIRGRHLCMAMRGVKKGAAITTSTKLMGIFLRPEVREEFLSAVREDIHKDGL